MKSGLFAGLSLLVLLLVVPLARSAGPGAPAPEALGAWWDRHHVAMPLPPLVEHADVEARLQRLAADDPGLFRLERVGASVEARGLYHLSFGRGPFPVLLWSQMHGDEPTATRALFDLFAYVQQHRARADVARLLDALTIHVVPMLNPDGAARFQRRNAQGIDINRDALMLQTPEARALKALRDRLEPRLGFNLHNQGWRTSVAKTGKPASISLLAVAYDEARSDNEGRVLAKKVAGLIRDSVEAFAPGQVARYDDEFEPRAFGDNITKWGTPVVLVETGPYPGPEPDRHLIRLNFVLLVTALDALASGRAHAADPARYESLPFNGSNVLYQLVRRAMVISGTGAPPLLADVGVVATRTVRADASGRRVVLVKRIEEFGDLSTFGAMETIEAEGLTVAPLWDPAVQAGDEVSLPDFASTPPAPVGPGQPASFVLLQPLDAGRYRVSRVFAAEELMQ